MTEADDLLPDLAALRRLLEARGGERYDGEDVTHLEHALQAATLARRAGACDVLVAAALLHDIGHLAHGRAGTPSVDGIDDAHESLGALLLGRWFPPQAVQAVRLHVLAKRHLAATPGYERLLSADSRRSLALQGGPLDDARQAEFLARPFARDAIRLRRWDEAAKTPRLPTPTLDELWPTVERAAL